jgi:hypothetical protein
MASSIASLFGPSAEEIVYAQQQQDMARRQAAEQQGMAMQSSPLAQQFYQSGLNITKGLGGLFGDAPMQDPRLGKNLKLRKILGDANVSDLTDPKKVSELSTKFSEAGLVQEALYFADRAKDLTAQQISLNKLNILTPTRYVTSEGEPVSKDGYGIYYTSKDKKPVDVGDIISDTIYKTEQKPAKAAGSTEQTQAINFLKQRTDLGTGDQKNAGTELANRAITIAGPNGDFTKALEQALNELKQENKLTDTGKEFLGLGSKWEWNPEGVAIPLAPSANQEWKLLPGNEVPQTTKMR